MRIKTHQIGYFLALCEEQSFTRAARRCGVAQPSLTRAIQELEGACGGQLFERSRSSITLTQLGLHLKPDFERIEGALSDVARKAAEFQCETKPNPQTQERYMRIVAVSILAVAIVTVGLALRPTPHATAAVSDRAISQVDPYALQSKTVSESLPWNTPDNLY